MLLQAIRQEYPGCPLFRMRGFFIVKQKNLDTKKYDFHLYGTTSKWKGFIITVPSMKWARKFITDISEE